MTDNRTPQTPKPKKTRQLNVRLSEREHHLLRGLAQETGLTQAAVIGQAIRLLARRERVGTR